MMEEAEEAISTFVLFLELLYPLGARAAPALLCPRPTRLHSGFSFLATIIGGRLETWWLRHLPLRSVRDRGGDRDRQRNHERACDALWPTQLPCGCLAADLAAELAAGSPRLRSRMRRCHRHCWRSAVGGENEKMIVAIQNSKRYQKKELPRWRFWGA